MSIAIAARSAMQFAIALLVVTSAAAGAQDTTSRRDSTKARGLAPVKIVGRIDDLVGVAKSASEGRVGKVDLRLRPITREGELLETVPGMIVTQHSGEGKANQYFVRGFNLDHGTDFQTRVEGMPINLPTHGHGQGYTDLNFLIPELVDYLDYKLGVSHADLGDFGSAGGAEFRLARRLDRSFGTFAAGANGLARFAAGGSTRVGPGDLLVGGEARKYDGPWTVAQDLRKASGLARYSWSSGASRFSMLGMAYRNTWNAADQVPSRAVSSGVISRFGQIDSTDGGKAQRYSLSGSWERVGQGSVQNVNVFGIYSDLGLFSNFTYFLDNPERGDQFNQVDRRTVIGGSASHAQALTTGGITHQAKVGLQTRADIINGLGLYRTERRERYETVRSDRVREVGNGLFGELESQWTPMLRTVVGGRADVYTFNVRSDRSENSGNETAGILSPKASVIFTPTTNAELYVSGGFGFHSNDARGTTITVDPASGDPAPRVDPLVRSRGAEVGLRTNIVNGFRSTLTAWTLDLDSELLFIGDAGATEASAASHRRGVTFANFYRPSASLALDADVSFARARFSGVEADAVHIPGALESVVAAGLTWSPAPRGVFGAVRLRRFGSYPLVEDNSVRARASTLLNADVGYQLTSGTRLQLTVLNLANARAEDIQYYYASRLKGESAGVDGIHSHPIEPRQVRLSIEYRPR